MRLIVDFLADCGWPTAVVRPEDLIHGPVQRLTFGAIAEWLNLEAHSTKVTSDSVLSVHPNQRKLGQANRFLERTHQEIQPTCLPANI
jgi:hypothetical protein